MNGHAFIPCFFTNPTILGDWLEVSDKLYKLFLEDLTHKEGHSHTVAMLGLKDDLESEVMFSELRCKKILPVRLPLSIKFNTGRRLRQVDQLFKY